LKYRRNVKYRKKLPSHLRFGDGLRFTIAFRVGQTQIIRQTQFGLSPAGHRLFDNILQFTHVAGPWVFLQARHYIFRYECNRNRDFRGSGPLGPAFPDCDWWPIFAFIYKKYWGLAIGKCKINERLGMTIFEKRVAKWLKPKIRGLRHQP
jgi:hypothetical protein